MKDKIKQHLKKKYPSMSHDDTFIDSRAEIINDCIQHLGLSNEWVSAIDKIEPDPDYGMPDYYQGFSDAIEAVEKLLPPSEAKL